MALSGTHLEDLLQFIREHRSNAVNFSKLKERLEDELHNATEGTPLYTALIETKEKYATAYAEALEQGGSAWPEYEAFIAHFERSVVAALKEE